MNNKTVNSCRAQFYIRAGAALSPQMFWLKQQYGAFFCLQKYAKLRYAAGAPLRTSLGELTMLSDPLV